MTPRPPRLLRGLFRRLLPGPLGEDARSELEEEYRRRREEGSARSAAVGYAAHLLRPDTWRLARALRRRERRMGAGLRLSWLDFKLAWRLLAKHPGLTATAGVAIAFAVTLAATSFEFFTDVFYPTLPVDEPHALVEVRTRELRTGRFSTRVIDDFFDWRDNLRSLEDVGAFLTSRRILSTPERGGRTVWGASMTAAAFRIARVPPLMGRGLVASDEVPGAPAVVVIGYDLWQSTFEGDPEVVGRTVRLGDEPATVVGVMPAGFRFPTWHDLWEPLRYRPTDFEPGEGPVVQVVARLAPGASLETAESELANLVPSTETGDAERRRTRRHEVVPYGRLPLPQPSAVTASIYWGCVLFFVLLLALVFGNVALLLFARTAAREKEIVVRSALGASRSRIVAQLVAESLVLAGGAAAVGLVVAGWGLDVLAGLMRTLQEMAFGYWVGGEVSSRTVVYTLTLTLGGAIACGVVPALKVTAGGRGSSRRGVAQAGTGPGFGRLWSGMIVIQIAATAAFVPILVAIGVAAATIRNADPGFAATEYLSVRLRADRTPTPGLTLAEFQEAYLAGYRLAVERLERRLEEALGPDAVTVAGQVPGGYHDYEWIRVDGPAAPGRSEVGHEVQTVGVDPGFFEVLDVPMVAGRGFRAVDLESGEDVVVVNEDFVRIVLGGRSPLGRRLRYVSPRDPEAEGPAHTIVGVVRQIAMNTDPNRVDSPGVYHPLGRTGTFDLRMIVRVGTDAPAFASRLQALAAEVAPGLQLLDLRPASEAAWDRELAHVAMFWLMLVAGGIAVLLSTSGIHSLMSFSVSRRTREIGVRVALGAGRVQVTSAVLSRTLRQIAIGVSAGGVLAFALLGVVRVSENRAPFDLAQAGMFGLFVVSMTGVCLLACLVPTARALRIEPSRALKADG